MEGDTGDQVNCLNRQFTHKEQDNETGLFQSPMGRTSVGEVLRE